MALLQGVYSAKKKDGTLYYRSSFTYRSKHISLGSYPTEELAHSTYKEASHLVQSTLTISDYKECGLLSFEKWVSLVNFRDNGHYIKNPIYLHKYYFSYYINIGTELFFDVDDLFYYAKHKIFWRNGYLFVNDYGMQVNILSRYGIKNFAVVDKDYYYKDKNPHNLRYHNVVVVNPYYGVEKKGPQGKPHYISKIHINGYIKLGVFSDEVLGAIAYNKAVDFVLHHGISAKNYTKNYITHLSTDEYLHYYNSIQLPSNLTNRTPALSS